MPSSEPASSEPAVLGSAVPGVEYAGCAEVLKGPICVLPANRELQLWIPDTNSELVWTPDGESAPTGVRSRAVEGGRLLRITVPKAATQIGLNLGSASEPATWTLSVADPRPREATSDEAREGYPALSRGEFDRAAEILSRIRQEQATAGLQLSEIKTAAIVVFCYVQQRRFGRARAVLESFGLGPQAPAEARFEESYYRGIIAMESGDSRTAYRALEEASGQARRLGLHDMLGMSGEMQATHLGRLGRFREAIQLFENLQREDIYSLREYQARLLHNYTWHLLLAREAGDPSDIPMADILSMLEDVQESVRAGRNRRDQLSNVRLSLAFAHLHNGRPDRARESLDQITDLETGLPTHLRPWWLDIKARIAFAEGRMEDALELYDRLQRLATSAFDPEGRRRAFVGRARALVAAGLPDAALEALAEAERLLDQQSLWIPLDQGRETFMARAAATGRLYLDLLLREGRQVEAFEAARRSRSRLLRGLQYRDRLAELGPEERQIWERTLSEYHGLRAELDATVAGDWQLSMDQLADADRAQTELSRKIDQTLDRALAVFGPSTDGEAEAPLPLAEPGELTLAYHPLPQGWVGFAALDGELEILRFQLPELAAAGPDELAAVLTEPFQSLVVAAERVKVLPFGELRDVDFHALPFADDILLAARPVIYGLDVTVPEAPTEAVGTSRRALIVADPRGDLPAAEREAERVQSGLKRDHPSWTVEQLRGNDAQAQAVIRALRGTDFLHYAGHGVFSGRAGWQSTLPMAAGSVLTLGDLLALEQAPAQVVLSACEAARVSSMGVEGLGLAHGFVLAGARQVIAASRPVDDKAAADMIAELYREWHGTSDLVEALRRAQLEQRRQGNATWAAFRALEP